MYDPVLFTYAVYIVSGYLFSLLYLIHPLKFKRIYQQIRKVF